VSWEANIPCDLWSIRFGLQPEWVVLTMEASLGSEHSYLTYWLFVFCSWLKFVSSQKKMMWFVLAGLMYFWCAKLLAQLHKLHTLQIWVSS
jgi:hypothetical protein